MIVWNHDKTAMVNLNSKDIKLETLKGKIVVVASDASSKYLLYSGENFANYFGGLSLHIKPVDPLEILNDIPKGE